MNYTKIYISFFIALLIFSGCGTNQSEKRENDATEAIKPEQKKGDKPGIALQMWSFHKFDFCQALDKAKKTGVKYLEVYPGQKIGGGMDGETHFTMSQDQKDFIRDTVKKAGLKMVQYGVLNCKNAEEWTQAFDFAQEMGFQTLNVEPDYEYVDTVAALAVSRDVKIGIHNHPKPSAYWHPDSVWQVLEGKCSHHTGFCVDNGHWTRSGLDVLEELEKVAARVQSVHFKDMNEKSMDAHTVVYGNGVNRLDSIIEILKQHHFDGYYTIEFEHKWDDNLTEIKQCVSFLEKNIK